MSKYLEVGMVIVIAILLTISGIILFALPTEAKVILKVHSVADIDKNGKVDIYDYSILVADWKKTGKKLRSDLNKDRVVNQKDLDIFLVEYDKYN